MPKDCSGCQWQRWAWCSIRDRLVSIGIIPPCVVPTGDELAEAKAEIERLREALEQTHDHLTHIRARLTERREYWEKRCLKAEHSLARLEITSADAEIGRLVRGMRIGTRLVRSIDNIYGVDECSQFNQADAEWKWIRGRWRDPAEALRSIQEVGDDEA